MQLSRQAFERARRFLHEQARPLERALFAHEFEGAAAAAAVDELGRFANADGGFGRALEPDLRLPDSSALATSQALRTLGELGQPADQPLVRSALAWLVEHFEPEIAAWRAVPPQVDQHPHAGHWSWALHAPGGSWPVAILPCAEVLSLFCHWKGSAPAELLDAAFAGLLRALPAAEAGADSVVYLDRLARAPQLPAAVARALAEHLPRLALGMLDRNPAEWTDYVAKPLKLAPSPESTLAGLFPDALALNLDWEIEQQQPDGSWLPNWSWRGEYPEHWEIAKREWQGVLTLERLLSLRAYGRLVTG
jgi:hypothetical protein